MILTGTTRPTPTLSAISYDSAASTAPSYAATAPWASVMPGFALTFLTAPSSRQSSVAGDSPTDWSVTTTNRTFLAFESTATATLWHALLPLPYVICLYSERDVPFSDEPSMSTMPTSYLSPRLVNHTLPSVSSSSILSEAILSRYVEYDGVLNRPAALFLAAPASDLYGIPVSSLNT